MVVVCVHINREKNYSFIGGDMIDAPQCCIEFSIWETRSEVIIIVRNVYLHGQCNNLALFVLINNNIETAITWGCI